MNVRLTEAQKVQLLNSQDVYKVMQQFLMRENKIRRNQEHFWVVGLDNASKILFIELISLGTVNSAQVKPPEVFRMGIYKLAVKMILVHNHPSGLTEPSVADLDLTDKLLKSGNMIEIEVIEHLIITEKDFISFANEGIIEDLKNNGRYELIDLDKAELQEYKMEMEKERVLKENNIKIGKSLKASGMSEDEIKKHTGLRLWDIRKL